MNNVETRLKRFLISSLCFVLTASSAFATPANQITIPDDPHYRHRDGLKASESAEFKAKVSDVAKQAKDSCEMQLQKLNAEGKSVPVAIVVDIDETVLDNRPEYQKQVDNYSIWAKAHPVEAAKTGNDVDGYFDPESFDTWVSKHEAREIKANADFVRWAHQKGIAVFFVTGRTSDQRNATILNLQSQNIPFDGLYLKPAGARERNLQSEDFKTGYRRMIEDCGFKILCNLGDQYSDLYGLHSVECFKVPNEMYFIE